MSRERYQNERRDQNTRYTNNNPHGAGRNNLHRRPASTEDLRQSKQGSRPGLPHCNNFQNHGHCNDSKSNCPYFHEGLDCVKHFKFNRCDYSGGQRNCRYQHRNVRKAIMPREEPDRLSLKSNDLRLSITRSNNQLDPNLKANPPKPNNSTSNPTETPDSQPDIQPKPSPSAENEPTSNKDSENQPTTTDKTVPEEKDSEIRDSNLSKLPNSNEVQPNPTQSTEYDNEIKPKSDETVEGKELKNDPLKESNSNDRGNHKLPLHNGEKKKEEYGDLRDEVRESIEAKEARFGRGDFRGDDRDFRRDERRNDRRKNWRRDESPHSKSRNSQKYFPQSRSVYQNSKNANVEDHSRDIQSAATISINEPGNTILTAARENNEKKATRTAEEPPNKTENETQTSQAPQLATVSPTIESNCEVKAESNTNTKPAEVPEQDAGREPVWKQYFNSTGVPFYYNAITRESKWNKPDEPNQPRIKSDEAEDRSKYAKNDRNERDSKYFKDKQQDRYRDYSKNDNYDLRYGGDLRENYSSRGSEDRTKTEYNETIKSDSMKDNLIKSDRNDGIASRDRLEDKADPKKDLRSRKALPDKRRRSLERVDRSLSRPPNNKYDERKHIKRDPPPRDTGDLRDTLVLPSNLSPTNYRKRHRSDPPYYSIKRFKDHHNPPTSPNYHRGSYPVHHDLRDELREDLRFNTGYRPYGVFYQKSVNYAGSRNQSQYSRAFGRNTINRNSKDDNREKLRAIRYHPGRPYNEGPRDHRDIKRSGREGKGRDRRNRTDRERMASKEEKEEKDKDNERESGKTNDRSERNEDMQSKNHYQKVLAKMIVHETLAGDLFEYVKNARKAVIENNSLLKNELSIISKPMEEQRSDQLGQTNSTYDNENVYAELDQQKEDLNPPYYLSDEYDNEYDHIKDQTMETIKQSIIGFDKLFVPSFLEDFKDPLYSYSNVVLKNIGLKAFSSDIYQSSLNQFRETIGLNELSEDDDFIETMELY